MARVRLFPTTNFFIASSAAFFAALPVLAVAGFQMNSHSQHTEPSFQAAVDNAPVLEDTTPAPAVALAATAGTSSANNNTQGNVSVSLDVNGQPIAVPTNGSTHQVITDGNGQTTVNFSAQNTTSGNGRGGRSSTHLNIHSSTTNTINTEQTDE